MLAKRYDTECVFYIVQQPIETTGTSRLREANMQGLTTKSNIAKYKPPFWIATHPLREC